MLRTLTRTVGSNPTVTARAESVESLIRHSARDLYDVVMAIFQIDDTGIKVKLSFWEKLGSIRGDLFIPVTSLRGAVPAEKNWQKTLGARIPGTFVPFLAIYGTYRWKNKDFVAWRRGDQVLQLNLSGKPYSRVFIGVKDAAALADEINDALTTC